jgi:hypothetical protein
VAVRDDLFFYKAPDAFLEKPMGVVHRSIMT